MYPHVIESPYQLNPHFHTRLELSSSKNCRVPKGGCSRGGGGNWGTLRIRREDWGTLGNIGED